MTLGFGLVILGAGRLSVPKHQRRSAGGSEQQQRTTAGKRDEIAPPLVGERIECNVGELVLQVGRDGVNRTEQRACSAICHHNELKV